MRKFILIILSSVFYFPIHGQVLYTENFDSHNIGNLSTDITGTVPGKGGWYTETLTGGPAYNIIPSVTEYQIVAEPGKGNVVQIAPLTLWGEWHRYLFRTDLKNYWQQRTQGNNVLKLSFDMFVGKDDFSDFRIFLYGNEGILANYSYIGEHQVIGAKPRNRADFTLGTVGNIFKLNGQQLTIPHNSWITLEMYIDYDNSKIYFSIPSLNYTIMDDFPYILDLNGVEHDDSPVKLMFFNAKNPASIPVNTFIPKFDNINISAQNTVPTLSVNEVLSNQFNLYPNPATSIVNITNSDNMFVNEVQVYDLSGKLINTQTFNNEAEIKLNVETLTSGTYLLHLQTDKGIVVKKLIKK